MTHTDIIQTTPKTPIERAIKVLKIYNGVVTYTEIKKVADIYGINSVTLHQRYRAPIDRQYKH